MGTATTTPGGRPGNGPARAPAPAGAGYQILAAFSPPDERTRVLKHGDTFAVLDHYGDIKPGGLEEGLFHDGTRFLSCLLLELEGGRPFYIGSGIRDENDVLSVALTNPDLFRDGGASVALGTLHLALKKFLWQGACHQRLTVRNYGLAPLETFLTLHFAADYIDIFEVRGLQRRARGEELEPVLATGEVTLGYRGRDGLVRRTRLAFSPPPSLLTHSAARIDLRLAPQEERTFELVVTCEPGGEPPRRPSFDAARNEAEADQQRFRAWSCHLGTSNGQLNAWIDRGVSDLHMMTTELSTGPYPYAGVPWFNTPFGRDGIITALECLWLRPGLARGVLAYLASTQATEVVPERDAEPGKILHETRRGEMAALGEIPFGQYYGSVDATPLFVLLAGSYYERTGDREFVAGLWPHLEAALDWIDRYGDRDGDSFVEYQRSTPDGLLHQGWKDSDDAVFHADGAVAHGPFALCEVQGYVYAAWRAAAALAAVLGDAGRAVALERRAAQLQERFEEAFWCEELTSYVIALDGDKKPCRVRSSNAGHCLYTGIARADRGLRAGRRLMGPDCFSGWGVRTIASSEARYNPMGYHTGSVWPHDNALIAQGLARYGLVENALQILDGQFQASLYFDLHRMPELFCGFPQQPGEGPVLYPLACAPQAWSAASVFLLFQACLGLTIDGLNARVSFTNPRLPTSLGELQIHNLEVGGGSVDLALVRHRHSVGVNVLRREGAVEILVIK